MDYGMIGKLQKAKKAERLVKERYRFKWKKIGIVFEGDETQINITFENNVFKCDCKTFLKDKNCEHTIALKELLVDALGVFEETVGKLPGDPTIDAPPPSKKKVRQ